MTYISTYNNWKPHKMFLVLRQYLRWELILKPDYPIYAFDVSTKVVWLQLVHQLFSELTCSLELINPVETASKTSDTNAKHKIQFGLTRYRRSLSLKERKKIKGKHFTSFLLFLCLSKNKPYYGIMLVLSVCYTSLSQRRPSPTAPTFLDSK